MPIRSAPRIPRSSPPVPSFPERAGRGAHRSERGCRHLQFAAPNLKTPYSQQANLAVSRRTGRRYGVHRFRYLEPRRESATASPTSTRPRPPVTPTRSKMPPATRPAPSPRPIYTTPRPNTKYGAILEDTNGTNSYYDALAVTLREALLPRLPVARVLYLVRTKSTKGRAADPAPSSSARSVPTPTTATTASSAAAVFSIRGTGLCTR